jgi:hypothetical protein
MMPYSVTDPRKLLLSLLLLAGLAATAADTNTVFAKRAENEFYRTQLQLKTDPKNATNVWQFAAACFELCDYATNATHKADIAKQGIAACQQLVTREPKSAPGHYYLAMNYGELADAEAPSIAAYKLVHDIEREFKASLALDEKLDFAGSSRCLGLLYRDAPGWPISIGSKRKARDFLERAATLAPNYPENQLNLAESFVQWRQRDDAEKALKKLDTIWSGAHTNLTGVTWEKPWQDWTNRRAAAKAEFQKVFKRVP